METITIKAWLDSGANAYSCYKVEFEVDKLEWEAMTEEQKDDYAKDYAWGNMDWGWAEQNEL